MRGELEAKGRAGVGPVIKRAIRGLALAAGGVLGIAAAFHLPALPELAERGGPDAAQAVSVLLAFAIGGAKFSGTVLALAAHVFGSRNHAGRILTALDEQEARDVEVFLARARKEAS